MIDATPEEIEEARQAESYLERMRDPTLSIEELAKLVNGYKRPALVVRLLEEAEKGKA